MKTIKDATFDFEVLRYRKVVKGKQNSFVFLQALAGLLTTPLSTSRSGQMAVTYHEALPLVVATILVELDVVDHFVLDRRL